MTTAKHAVIQHMPIIILLAKANELLIPLSVHSAATIYNPPLTLTVSIPGLVDDSIVQVCPAKRPVSTGHTKDISRSEVVSRISIRVDEAFTKVIPVSDRSEILLGSKSMDSPFCTRFLNDRVNMEEIHMTIGGVAMDSGSTPGRK